jgi:Zn-dependent membrane protease YugP
LVVYIIITRGWLHERSGYEFSGRTGVAAMLASALLQLIILPMEWDASFNKAMPILFQGNYVPEQYQPVIKKILTAAALTYFAGALINVLQLWRWLAILRGVVR